MASKTKKSLKAKKIIAPEATRQIDQLVSTSKDQSPRIQESERSHTCDDHKHSNFKEKFQHFIGLHSDAPDYIKDNDYIKTGYRINFSSPGKVLQRYYFIQPP